MKEFRFSFGHIRHIRHKRHPICLHKATKSTKQVPLGGDELISIRPVHLTKGNQGHEATAYSLAAFVAFCENRAARFMRLVAMKEIRLSLGHIRHRRHRTRHPSHFTEGNEGNQENCRQGQGAIGARVSPLPVPRARDFGGAGVFSFAPGAQLGGW